MLAGGSWGPSPAAVSPGAKSLHVTLSRKAFCGEGCQALGSVLKRMSHLRLADLGDAALVSYALSGLLCCSRLRALRPGPTRAWG